VAEVAHALTESGAQSLVYLVPGNHLVPGDGQAGGYAVVVPGSGPVEVLTLDELRTGAAPLDRYVRAHRDWSGSDESDPRQWRAALDGVCGWAWRVAMGDIVASCRRLSPDRPPRIVLVPMGVLGLVPWSAAWREVDGARRYAVHDAVVSLVASARLLCEAAGRARLTDGDALVVGDPEGTLPVAGVEARAIHATFYPDGTYLGQPAERGSGPGTPDEVTEWITRATGRAGAMLHVASHGVAEMARPADSHLRLAGGEPLLVRDLMERSAGSRRDLGTVLLAACTTNLAGETYDEALSLATAFLVMGARSVFGSLWAVPDHVTSALMFMIHHYLRARPDDPAGALRQAQLWMLDRDRSVPGTMPPDLARYARRSIAAEPVAWAGFVHLGVPARR
jgi:CHAT domain-containing protein